MIFRRLLVDVFECCVCRKLATSVIYDADGGWDGTAVCEDEEHAASLLNKGLNTSDAIADSLTRHMNKGFVASGLGDER